jgi:hypothetical protein
MRKETKSRVGRFGEGFDVRYHSNCGRLLYYNLHLPGRTRFSFLASRNRTLAGSKTPLMLLIDFTILRPVGESRVETLVAPRLL